MYLTRFQVNPRRRGAAKLLTSPQAMHAAVLAGFVDPSPTEAGRVLWRLDTNGHATIVYIVSPARPDLTHLVEQASWPTTSGWDTRDYRPLLDRIENGQRWGFRLTANPVWNKSRGSGLRGTPQGHVTVAQQESWLLDRQSTLGARLVDGEGNPTMLVTRRDTLEFARQDARVTLRVAQFDGTLVIEDRNRFLRALTHGVGRAKGYGCGLVTIAPAGEPR